MNKTFHVCDVRAVWVRERASALSRQVATVGWLPHISTLGYFRHKSWSEDSADPVLSLRHFPLQRGFARTGLDPLFQESSRIIRRLNERTDNGAGSCMICTAPAYTPSAEKWPGLLIYYVTDAFAYPGYTKDPTGVIRLDRRMCNRADFVFPNSRRIADYLIRDAHCPEEKIAILPNATRAANILPAPLFKPVEAPADISDMPRPIAGVIGNLAANMDWEILHNAVERTPWLSWVFVGPTEMPVQDENQRRCRTLLMNRGGRVRFTGFKLYSQLCSYARAFDVAVLPYRRCEPTYSGSATRFYEHLAACRPILATRGVEELLHKEPLLCLIDSANEMVRALEELAASGFRDGREALRWETSHQETWEARAATMLRVSGQSATGSQLRAFEDVLVPSAG